MSTTAAGTERKRRIYLLMLAGFAIAGLTWYCNHHVSLADLIEHEQRLRQAIANRPWHAFLTGLGIYAIVSLIPGTSGKSVVFAWMFGFWQGVILILLGLTAAATVNFQLSRYIFRDWIEQRYTGLVANLNTHLAEEGAFYLLTLRMAHFPFSIINLISGASRVRLQTFCWTTALGLLPGTAVFAWVGVRLPSLDQLASHGTMSLLDPVLLVALAASAILPIFLRLAIRRITVMHYAGETDQPHHNHQPRTPGVP